MRLLIAAIFIFLNTICSSAVLAEDVVIIINEKNPISELSEEQIANFFLKKNRLWPSGEAVRIFDQPSDKEERKIFLKNYIKKSSRELELYWIGQKLYTGYSAPLQINSDLMTGVVARFPGAIGYVSSSFSGAPGVKKILISRETKE